MEDNGVGGHLRTNSGIPTSASGRHPLQTVDSTCFVPAKSSGIVSLCVQFTILVLTALITIFFFYHVGGYEYMGWNENSTMLAPIENSRLPPKFYSSLLLHGNENSTDKEVETLLRSSNISEDSNTTLIEEVTTIVSITVDPLLAYEDNSTITYDDTDEQLPDTNLYIGWIVDAEIDFLELMRISTLVYLAMCAVWFLSLLCLVVAIKTESKNNIRQQVQKSLLVPDLVVANMTISLITILYLIVHALFIGILIYLQITLHRHLSTRTFVIIIGTISTLLILSIAGIFCVILDVAFYNYICYMNDSSGCICLSVVTKMIKGSQRNRRGPHEYALPENTRPPPNANIPYADEPITHTQQQFSHF